MTAFYEETDCLVGDILGLWGQKFNPVTKQNFIKVIGSASAIVRKCEKDESKINKIKEYYPHFNFRGNLGDEFKKRKRLIVEPYNSDCPGAKGGKSKHVHKKGGHTPSTEWKAEGDDSICAICYISYDKQERKQIILAEFESNI